MKRAQMNTMFVYLFSAVVIAVVLIFGTQMIFKFLESGAEAQMVQFQHDLQTAISSLSVDFGSIRTKTLHAPPEIQEVCFVDSYGGMPDLIGTGYPLIEDSVNSGAQQNVFFRDDSLIDGLTVGDIAVDGDLLCIPIIRGALEIQLEGKGNHVFISSLRQ